MSDAPRTLHVITGLDGGGAERFLADLLPCLWPDPARAAVMTLQGPGVVQTGLEAGGFAVHNMGSRRGRPPGPGAWRRARRWAVEWAPEVVFGWMYHGNCAAYYLTRAFEEARRPNLMWSVHQSMAGLRRERWLTRMVWRWSRRHSRRVDRIVYVSRRSRGQHAAAGWADDRAACIPNGFDVDRFVPDDGTPDGPRASVRRELGLSADAPLVLRVGRVDPMKDYPTLFTAFARVHDARPDAHLVLAGAGTEPDAPLFADWHRRHRALEINTHWLGWRDDVARLTAAADVAVSPSSMKEAFPLAVGEAMACGVPCVTTDVGDAAWMVADTGRVTPPDDPAALAETLLSLLDAPPEERRALGRAARARASVEFPLARVADAYRDVLLSTTRAGR